MVRVFSKTMLFSGVVSCLILLSCGYSMKRQDAAVVMGKEGEIITVFIPVVDNVTTRTGPENIVTQALREEMASLNGMRVVNSEDEAEFLLLGKITGLSTKSSPDLFRGSTATEAQGGLRDQEVTAKSMIVDLNLEIKFMEKTKNSLKQVWVKNFKASEGYPVSRDRYTRQRGASSAAYISESRELIQLKLMSEELASQVFEQVSLNF